MMDYRQRVVIGIFKFQIRVLSVDVFSLYVLTTRGAVSGGLGNLVFTHSYYSFSFLGHNPHPHNTFWD